MVIMLCNFFVFLHHLFPFVLFQLGGIQPHIIPTSHDGTYDTKELVHRLRDEDVHCPRTTLICLENTHNKCGGKVLPLSWIDEVSNLIMYYTHTSVLWTDRGELQSNEANCPQILTLINVWLCLKWLISAIIL